MTNKGEEPMLAELAPLPREDLGPFLLLGVDKDADQAQIEARWAERVAWARKNQTALSLQDLDWAREVIADPDQRVKADAASINADTIERTLRGLEEEFGLAGSGAPAWPPLDVEKPLADCAPAVEIPDPEAVCQAIRVPPVPCDMPGVVALLEHFARQPLDPWKLDLPSGP